MRARWTERASNHRLPLWVRVACYAEAHANPIGICKLKPEELHHALDPTLSKPAISRAIATAIKHGWLHPTSSARYLVLEPVGGALPERGGGGLQKGGAPHQGGASRTSRQQEAS